MPPYQVYSDIDMDSSTSSFYQAITAASLQDVQRKGNAEPGSLAKASLYVTDLDASVTEADLYDLFSEHGQVLSVKICRDRRTGVSRGYGYVNFRSLQYAIKAMELLNLKSLNGKHIRVMLSNQDPNLSRGGTTIFFKDFDKSLDIGRINEDFSNFGAIITSELATDSKGQSKGYGYVMFNEKEAAETAMHVLDNMGVYENCVSVVPFIRKEDRDREKPKFQNYPTLYVENMVTVLNDEEVKSAFGKYGPIAHVHVVRDYDGYVTGSGFVVFENFADAVSAIKGLNGKSPTEIKGLEPLPRRYGFPLWYVGWANSMFKTKDRWLTRPEKERSGIPKRLEGANLYIKNFDDDMTEKKLMQLFSEHGMILYCKVMLDSQGLSRGYGFVGFVTPEEATKAMNAMNGKIIGRKPLHVSVARRRKDRKANLQVLREQCHSGTMYTQLASEASGMLFETDEKGMRHVPWSQNIQEDKVGEAVDSSKFNDTGSGPVQVPYIWGISPTTNSVWDCNKAVMA